MTILWTAYTKGHTNLVLGALGCGCFRSPAHETATVFKECLDKYEGAFTKVVFAILDQNTRELGPLALNFNKVLSKE